MYSCESRVIFAHILAVEHFFPVRNPSKCKFGVFATMVIVLEVFLSQLLWDSPSHSLLYMVFYGMYHGLELSETQNTP